MDVWGLWRLNVVAIMENYIQEDGSLLVPEPLRKYTGFDVIEKK